VLVDILYCALLPMHIQVPALSHSQALRKL